MLKYNVILEKGEEGIYTVTIASLPGCISEGRTIEEALTNIQDAIKGYLIVLAKHNRPIPVELEECKIPIKLDFGNLTKKMVVL